MYKTQNATRCSLNMGHISMNKQGICLTSLSTGFETVFKPTTPQLSLTCRCIGECSHFAAKIVCSLCAINYICSNYLLVPVFAFFSNNIYKCYSYFYILKFFTYVALNTKIFLREEYLLKPNLKKVDSFHNFLPKFSSL